MKEQKLLFAMNDIRDEYITEAKPKKKSRAPIFAGTAAAAACVGLAAVTLFNSAAPTVASAAVFTAEYPECVKYVSYDKSESKHDEWWKSRNEKRKLAQANTEPLNAFIEKAMPTILADSGTNAVFSPLALYEALAMLADTTGGETQQQILSLLGGDSESVRATASALFSGCYTDDGIYSCIPANSIWLDGGLTYREDALKTLAEDYFASSFSGEFGSEEYDKMLKDWLSQQTGGLLDEQASSLEIPESTLLALVSTLYFSARWELDFDPADNTRDVFHSPSGDTEAEYMNMTVEAPLYWGENFQAYSKSFAYDCGGSMLFVLPDEGVSVNDLLSDSEFYRLLFDTDSAEHKFMQINLTLPKFDIICEQELSDSLKALGVTEVFSQQADFSPLLSEPAALSKIQQATRVVIDEEGCKAASFVVEFADGGAPIGEDEVDLVFDRPFIFVIRDKADAVLFAGVVNQP